MQAFEFVRPGSLEAAQRLLREEDDAMAKAGGIDVLDRMKERVDEPHVVVGLVDVQGAARAIRREGDVLVLGSLVTLGQLAEDESVRTLAPSLSEAAAQSASLQIRNVATLAGNLAQHTRCGYYRHRSFPCFKRGDAACPVRADGAVQELAGIYANRPCACAHPSSLAPVLGALGASVQVLDGDGERSVAFPELWASPRQGVRSDLALAADALITEVRVPVHPRREGYVEVRQKAAFDWPLVAAAVSLRTEGRQIVSASVWLGAVAPTPLRAPAAEGVLIGTPYSEALAARAGAAATGGATPLAGTAYKVPLVETAVKRAVVAAWGRAS